MGAAHGSHLSFCGVPRDADWTLVIPDPMLRVGSALGFSHTQPEHAQRGIENGASIARGRSRRCTIFCTNRTKDLPAAARDGRTIFDAALGMFRLLMGESESTSHSQHGVGDHERPVRVARDPAEAEITPRLYPDPLPVLHRLYPTARAAAVQHRFSLTRPLLGTI